MARLPAICGFPVSRNYRFRLGAKRYRLRSADVRALKLLAQIVEQAPDSDHIAWLCPLRAQIREIERIGPRAALSLVVARTSDEGIRRLAIWLRGRCGGTLGTSTVSRFSASANPAIRKEVTRCLKRLSAWSALRKIAENDSDLHIRRLAAQAPPVPYTERLAAFSQHVPRRSIHASQSQLVVSSEVELTQSHPPKPGWLIRLILERIHRLVTRDAR